MNGATLARGSGFGRLWVPVLIFLCVAIGLYGMSFLGGRSFGDDVGANAAGYTVLLIHAAAAGLALALGPWQFVYAIRVRWPKVHRTIGKAYVLACVVGGVSGVVLALGTAQGPVARWGFFALAVGWLTTTTLAYMTARRRNFSAHRKWMIRSFALAFAAVTLRIYLATSLMSGLAFAEAYPIIAWACWVPNLIVAELYILWSRDPFRPGPLTPSVTPT
jgi:uncharacterized membrane protein